MPDFRRGRPRIQWAIDSQGPYMMETGSIEDALADGAAQSIQSEIDRGILEDLSSLAGLIPHWDQCIVYDPWPEDIRTVEKGGQSLEEEFFSRGS